VLSHIDDTSQGAIVYKVQRLQKDNDQHNGQWTAPGSGFESFRINNNTRIYADGVLLPRARANRLLNENEVYISTRRDFGGVEITEQIVVNPADNKELLYNGYIRDVRRPARMFGITNGPSDIITGDWTIVISRDGRLVTGAAITQDDLAYVVANREDATGRIRANVVVIRAPAPAPRQH
jgi:hypothetical protein